MRLFYACHVPISINDGLKVKRSQMKRRNSPTAATSYPGLADSMGRRAKSRRKTSNGGTAQFSLASALPMWLCAGRWALQCGAGCVLLAYRGCSAVGAGQPYDGGFGTCFRIGTTSAARNACGTSKFADDRASTRSACQHNTLTGDGHGI